MRKLQKLLFFIMLLATVTACNSNNDDAQPQYLEATYANVSGTWVLSSWNGQAQTASPYVYINLDRKEHTFDIYQNLESDKSKHVTGTYSISIDENDRYLIEGTYDYSSGWWKHDYQITHVSATEMTWTATDQDDVSVYTRVSSIPDNILNGTRK